MKRLFLFLFALISISASAQVLNQNLYPPYGHAFKRGLFDSTLIIPKDTFLRFNQNLQGAIVYNNSDSAVYAWNGSFWLKQGRAGSPIDTFHKWLPIGTTTSGVPEGSNLYWTTARTDARYPLTSGSYINPSWITSIPFSKITNTPTSLSGYGVLQSDAFLTLQNITTNGSVTSNNIFANGGITSSGNMNVGLGAPSMRLNRFVNLLGNSMGVQNGAIISFMKSDTVTKTGAIGDGSSWDDNMFLTSYNNNDIRISNSSGQLGTDPYSYPMSILGYNKGGLVLINDSATNGKVPITNKLSVRGNAQIYNTVNNSAFVEFTDGRKDRVSVGMLGQPEANLSYNMDYTNRIHKFYDSTLNASWLAIGANAGAIQYALANNSTGDIWYDSGSHYALYWTYTGNNGKLAINTDIYNPAGDGNLLINRAGSEPSITGVTDLVLDGARTKGTAGLVYLNAYNSGNIYLGLGGGNTAFGLGTPTSRLHAFGSVAFPSSTINASTTLDGTYYQILANNSSAITITLPTSASCPGRVYVIKKISNASANVNIQPAGSELLDGSNAAKSITLQYSSIIIQSNGTSWYINGVYAAGTVL